MTQPPVKDFRSRMGLSTPRTLSGVLRTYQRLYPRLFTLIRAVTASAACSLFALAVLPGETLPFQSAVKMGVYKWYLWLNGAHGAWCTCGT